MGDRRDFYPRDDCLLPRHWDNLGETGPGPVTETPLIPATPNSDVTLSI